MYPVIIVGGFGRTGTEGLLNLLNGDSKFDVIPNYDYGLLTSPGGLINLKYCVTDNWSIYQSHIGINNFVKLHNNLKSYWGSPYFRSNFKKLFGPSYQNAIEILLDELSVTHFNGIWAGENSLVKKLIYKLFNKKIFIGNDTIRFCKHISDDKFYKITKKFIQTMHSYRLNKFNKEIIVINETFSSQNPKQCMDITGANKIIIVYRDPRDTYASYCKTDWAPRDPQKASKYLYEIHNRWFSERKNIKSDNYIEIKFEDLIYDNKNTLLILADFLNLKLNDDLIEKSRFSKDKAHVGRWRENLNKSDIKEINNIFYPVMEFYHYE